jgi:tRNA-specific 2-thiouridylase
VRKIAEQIGLHNAAKKDSTGICFIGERPFREFLNRYLPSTPGLIKTPEGKTVGEHMGLAFFTLGQRKGIGLGGSQDGNGDAWYVARKDISNNTLYVAQGHEHPWLLANQLSTIDASWIAGAAPAPGQYSAKTRYRQADSTCTLAEGSAGPLSFELTFPQAQWAVTPGQSAVLYDGDICLGGGIISA